MSGFIRPELIKWLSRNTEALISGCILSAGVLMLWRGVLTGGVLPISLGVLLILVALPLLQRAVRRLRLSRGHSPGVVLFDERRVGFFGPEGGGFLETDHLYGVDFETGPEGPQWLLIGEEATNLRLPVSAKGAEGLYDLFTTLPGFPVEHALSHLEASLPGRQRIWRRPSARKAGGTSLSGKYPEA